MSKLEDQPGADDFVLCRVTPWYYRRMGLAAGMCLLFALYFLYDWKIGYPKENSYADKRDWFENELLPSYHAAKVEGRFEAWIAEARAKGWPAGNNGEPPKWLLYSAEKGWPEKPKRHTQKEVDEQLWWGLGTGAVALALLLVLLLNRHKTLTGTGDHLVTPEGETVLFADVFKVDKRRWDQKGLAYVWHRTADGRERRAVIDDLKFDGAHRVLDKLLAAFKGKLLEQPAAPDEEAPETPTMEAGK